jgi:hypothetical protein
MNINDMTIGDAKAIAQLLGGLNQSTLPAQHSMIGRRCLIRTYSAGVHIGDVVSVSNGTEVLLKNALRLCKCECEGGGLSLSAVASKGIKGGRLNNTGEVLLTNAIEFIPTTATAEDSYAKYIEG